MSDFTVIRAVSLTLKALLEDAITHTTHPEVPNVPIELGSPKELRGSDVVSLWLYRVSRNAETLNDPPRRPAPDRELFMRLPLDLHYLLTPINKDPATRHVLIGRILQAFNDQSIVRGAQLRDTLAGESDELRVTLETLSLEELARIWTALGDSYEPSITYLVTLAPIDSDREPVSSRRVLTKRTTYVQGVPTP